MTHTSPYYPAIPYIEKKEPSLAKENFIKIAVTILFFCNSFSLSAQNLKNTEWFQVLRERTDGSEVLNRLQLGSEAVKYYFGENTVLIGTNAQYSTEQQYSLKDGKLRIGNFIVYKVDSLSEQYLVVTDNPETQHADSQLHTFTFLNIEYLFSYLKQNEQIDILEDSIIQATNLFSPAYKGDLVKQFLQEFQYVSGATAVSFILLKDGSVSDIQTSQTSNISKRNIERIKHLIKNTQYFWIVPPTPKPFNYQMKLYIRFAYDRNMSSISVTFRN